MIPARRRDDEGLGRLLARCPRGTRALPAELRDGPSGEALWLQAPGGVRGVVVLAHGGGNDRLFGLWSLARAALQRGLSVLTAHLPGHGRAGDDTFCVAATRARLDALVAEARERSDRVAVVGQSMGGAFALDQLARGRGADLTLAVSAPSHLRPRLAVLRELTVLARRTAWSTLSYVSPWNALPAVGRFRRRRFPVRVEHGRRYTEVFQAALAELDLPRRLSSAPATGPVWLFHGTADGVVPVDQARGLHEALGHRAARLHLVPGGLHLDLLLRRDVVHRVADLLRDTTGA